MTCDWPRLLFLCALALIALWVMMFFSLFAGDSSSSTTTNTLSTTAISASSGLAGSRAVSSSGSVSIRGSRSDKVLKPSRGHQQPAVNLQDLLSEKLPIPTFYSLNEKLLEPPPLEDIAANMSIYLHRLHDRFHSLAGPGVTPEKVWEVFFEETKRGPMLWDDLHRDRFPRPRRDGSIFVSVGSYRDPFCSMTVRSLYAQAAHPDRIFVAIFQQNCFGPVCKTGVLVGGKVEDTRADEDCYQTFCSSEEGKSSQACQRNQVRVFNVNESESLGPYMARYLGSKFYRGEQYYLQIDSHSEFVSRWDDKLIAMVQAAEAEKPVISTYPPDSHSNWKDSIGYRMCDSEFAAAQIEWQIIRLGTSLPFDKKVAETPRYAPFVAAGFFFGPSELLREVPFDPLLPWIFMGEEISLSARLWTAGYDIFSPTTNVLNHYYVRRHYPKFWESVNRFFHKPSIHNDIVELVIHRVKHMLGYPESREDLVHPSSLLYRHQDWAMGKKRPLKKYLEMVGLDMMSKQTKKNIWCHHGEWPEQAKPYRVLARNGDKRRS
eukprot:scaffold537_cov180-Ochromonas_danica.AAC.13